MEPQLSVPGRVVCMMNYETLFLDKLRVSGSARALHQRMRTCVTDQKNPSKETNGWEENYVDDDHCDTLKIWKSLRGDLKTSLFSFIF